MFSSLALAAALTVAPSQGSIKLTNVRTTYGELGPVRSDAKFLPGDLFFLAFDIEGITLSPEGKVSYSMAMEVLNRAGTRVFPPPDPKEPNAPVKPFDREEHLPLGGNRLPARAFLLLDLNQQPGAYTCRVTVTDRTSKATTEVKHAFEVLPKGFGIVSLFTTSDGDGRIPTPPAGHTGQTMYIHAALVGYTRDKDNKTDVFVEFRILDENGKPTLPRAITPPVPKEIDRDAPVSMIFPVPFNRPGKFIAEIVATDNKNNGRKTPPLRLPILIVESAR